MLLGLEENRLSPGATQVPAYTGRSARDDLGVFASFRIRLGFICIFDEPFSAVADVLAECCSQEAEFDAVIGVS